MFIKNPDICACVCVYSSEIRLKETNTSENVLEIYSLIFPVDSSFDFMCFLIGAALDFLRTNA